MQPFGPQLFGTPSVPAPLKRLVPAIRAGFFWASIAFPVVYLVVLLELIGGRDPSLFFGLLAVNLASIPLGYGHSPEGGSGDRASGSG